MSDTPQPSDGAQEAGPRYVVHRDGNVHPFYRVGGPGALYTREEVKLHGVKILNWHQRCLSLSTAARVQFCEATHLQVAAFESATPQEKAKRWRPLPPTPSMLSLPAE